MRAATSPDWLTTRSVEQRRDAPPDLGVVRERERQLVRRQRAPDDADEHRA